MALVDRLQKEMVAAMKARNESVLSALRLMKAALMKEKVDSMKELDEAAEMKVLNSLMKQRREAMEMFRKAGREEQAAKEEAELKLIEGYLPAAASDEELDAAVAAAIAEAGAVTAKDMGKIIAAAKTKLGGKRADGKALSDKVRAKLA